MSQHTQNTGRRKRKPKKDPDKMPKKSTAKTQAGNCTHKKDRVFKGYPYDFCLDCRTFLKEKA